MIVSDAVSPSVVLLLMDNDPVDVMSPLNVCAPVNVFGPPVFADVSTLMPSA